MTLRPYQNEAIAAVEREFFTLHRHSTLICLATGCGKTIVFSSLAKREVQRGGMVLILAHRGELLEQAIDKLEKSTGIKAGLEKAEFSAQDCDIDEPPYTVVVGSVQTLSREKRLRRFRPDEFSLIVIDECHHAMSNTYRTVIDYFSGAKILGVTATPDRGDMQSLGEVFETIAYEYSIVQAIRDGYLVPVTVQTIPLKIDITSVLKQSGDYQAGSLGTALDPYLAQICKEISERCKSRKTIVFTPLIATSLKMVEMFKGLGVEVREVNGESKDRADVIKWFARAKPGCVIVNSMLLTEGFDEPSADCIVILRATRVRALYVQMLGRGTRLCEGKNDLLVLDFLWLTASHDLCRPASLITEDPEVAEKITKRQEELEDGQSMSIDEETLEVGISDTVIDRENRLAERLKKQANKKAALIDPLKYASQIGTIDLSHIDTAKLSENDKPTLEQIDTLEEMGIACPLSGAAAKAIIDKQEERSKKGLATPKQIRCLTQRGFQNVEKWTSADAKRIIARLVMHGWRSIPGIDPSTYNPNEMK